MRGEVWNRKTKIEYIFDENDFMEFEENVLSQSS
jgi:hypothetical protein